MKVRKWVDFGQEVEVNIGADDIRAALAEAFETIAGDRLGENGPNRNDVCMALNNIAGFLNGITDQQIGLLYPTQRSTVEQFLLKAAQRFRQPFKSPEGE